MILVLCKLHRSKNIAVFHKNAIPFLILINVLLLLASGPPEAAHTYPSGLKRHSRGEEAFKEGNFSKKIFFSFSKF